MKIVPGLCDDWDLRDGELIAYWSRRSQLIRTLHPQFTHLSEKPATEAHGLLILNAIKAQLEQENSDELLTE